MVITFGTQKGGVGKTTIAIALANYLALDKKRKVFAYDFDSQKSFYKRWEIDNKNSELPQLYEVKVVDTEADLPFDNVEDLQILKESQDIHLFDLGGMLDAKYSWLLCYSDILVIPFEYSTVSIESTMVFVDVVGRGLESEASLVFIRNRYDKNYKYPNQEYMDNILQDYGELVPTPIYKRNDLQKINTREFKKDMKDAIKTNLDELIEIINTLTENKYNL